MTRSRLAPLAVLLLSGCAASRPSPASAPSAQAPRPEAPVVPHFATEEALRADAQATVRAFGDAVAQARGEALAEVPTVEVRNTPQLIFFNPKENRIVVPWWDTTPDAMRSVFQTFGGGDAAEGERLFRAVFNRFLVAHETAHWFQGKAGRREATLYANENMANRFAVAFWRTQPDGERFLAALEALCARAAASVPDPTPAGEDPVAYFGANYRTLGAEPTKYGYYQFRFMHDALRERATLDFARMVQGPAR